MVHDGWMKPYSDIPTRALRQVFADALGVVAVWTAVRLALGARDRVMELKVIGETVESAGKATQDNVASIGSTLADVPLIGDTIAQPFGAAGSAAASVTAAGVDIQDRVHDLAVAVAWFVGTPLVLLILLVWLTPRIMFTVRAARMRTVASSAQGLDLLALRALLTQDPHRLVARVPHAAHGWRTGDREVIAALAAYEMRSVGVAVTAHRSATRSRASRTP